jgi:nickel-dependent lactate racemase
VKTRLEYGRSGLDVEFPDSADVIQPKHLPAAADETAALVAALRHPIESSSLRGLVHAGDSVGIVVCDVTRPFPASRVLPVLLDELPSDRITVFIATGTHRKCTAGELQSMLGADVLNRVLVVQHDAFDRARHTRLGSVPGTDVPALVETEFLEQHIRITTGFIEPHFFAGFSGGPKMVSPGLAALETVLELHSAARIGHPDARWGIVEGNPVHDPVRAIAARAGVNFNLDLTLNREHEITNVFAGELMHSHRAGCEFARRTAMVAVDAPYDVVVTTNSGYPLDQNLYQSVKGMSAAAQIVKRGGAIVIAAECADGMPDHGGYKDLLREAKGPTAFLSRLGEPGFSTHDQWQVQIQALVQQAARVFVKNAVLTDAEIRQAWLEPVDDVAEVVRRLMKEAGPRARLAVLPEGPQTAPYITERAAVER